ncbi:tripartite tricarboxylate transporter TctB family protein [Azospirillum sp. SYSU D00513]|uniref:tripartite tricarboxylate transporter TctB family protein n=1 Tax=Azospirillum sp. SYSU D00513 TaxID=2812561 RepID=UPI001A9655E8|nr:tripartite tricarboxylate transporter TctB family protein [Azospirillum sp. SYSU D00513]
MHTEHSDQRAVVSVRTAEIGVALLFILASIVVMIDSVRVGNGWAADGPEAGYFPFYVGVVMFIASTGTLVGAIRARGTGREAFVEHGQLRLILKVFVPSVVFVALIWPLGIYVASALFIAFFMGWVGRYRPHVIAPVAVLVPLALFAMFEVWFLVPLPKGPLEALFGY